jgi:hypothetical protein
LTAFVEKLQLEASTEPDGKVTEQMAAELARVLKDKRDLDAEQDGVPIRWLWRRCEAAEWRSRTGDNSLKEMKLAKEAETGNLAK